MNLEKLIDVLSDRIVHSTSDILSKFGIKPENATPSETAMANALMLAINRIHEEKEEAYHRGIEKNLEF